MSVSFGSKLPSLVILNGATTSSALSNFHTGDAVAIGILSPAGLDVATYKIQITADEEATVLAGSATWYDLQDNGGNALNAGAASCAKVFTELCGFGFRIVASVAVTADRTFSIRKLFQAGE